MKKKIVAALTALFILAGAAVSLCGCKDDDTLVCGVTVFENMNEQDENGNWSGFECEFATEVAETLGMNVEFQIIDWSQKYSELNSGKIDCIWNGFTANSSDEGVERKDLVDFSYSYMLNQQCVVVRAAELDDYKTEADLVGKTAAVEGGSAGASYAKEAVGANGTLVEFPAQNSTFLEVLSGKSQFAVVDILLAQNVCGKGDYADLVIVEDIKLSAEYYAVGFKKGSELTEKVNAAIKQLDESGKLLEIAKKYGLENSLKVTY